MAIVELRFSPLPEHVRTARLVAAAVARRAGMAESVLDEVRLAVGEACSRAVGMARETGAEQPVVVLLDDGESRFSIEVHDGVPQPESENGTAGWSSANGGASANGHSPGGSVNGAPDSTESELGLAVILGLVDELTVTTGKQGGVIRMSWPCVDARSVSRGSSAAEPLTG